MLEIGSVAPDFALEDQTRQIVRLSDFLGKKHVVLAFHPFAFTPDEERAIRERLEQARASSAISTGRD